MIDFIGMARRLRKRAVRFHERRLNPVSHIDLATIEWHRDICRKAMFWSVIAGVVDLAVAASIFLFAREYTLFAILTLYIFSFSIRMFREGRRYLETLHKYFYKQDMWQYITALEKESGRQRIVPKMKLFLGAPDLVAFEQQMISFYIRDIKECRMANKKKRVADDMEIMKKSHEELDHQIRGVVGEIKDLDLNRVEKKLRLRLSLSQKRSMLSEVFRFAIHGQKSMVNQSEAKLQKLLRVLENLAESELCEEAKALHERAVASTDQKVQESLLKQAIEAERLASKKKQPKTIPKTSALSACKSETIGPQYLRLWDVAREKFQISDIVPPGTDAFMVQAIMLSLLDPGRSVNLFEGNYRPEEAIKRRVIRFYTRFGERFNPAVFERTLSTLHQKGVLFSKPKTDKRVFSLSAKVSDNKSFFAQELIKRAIGLNRELKA